MKKNKRILAMLMAVLMIFGITACNNSANSANNSYNTDNGAGSVADNGKALADAGKDSVVIAIGSEPETLDPTKGWGHGNSPIVQSTLVKYTSELNFENDLAVDYKLSDDGLTWTFTIRDDAYFTDGEKVTADDVAFTLETAKASNGSFDLTYMESAVAQDAPTVMPFAGH